MNCEIAKARSLLGNLLRRAVQEKAEVSTAYMSDGVSCSGGWQGGVPFMIMYISKACEL